MKLWRDVPGYEGLYQVSNEGNAKSLAKTWIAGKGAIRHQEEKLLKPAVNSRGYLIVCLNKNGKKKTKTIHKLVAQVFIPNPLGLPEVNHKDENKLNNRVENLEWCDSKYNCNYGTRNQRITETNTNGKRSKQVYQYTLDGRLVKIWSSTAECGRNGFSQSAVAACCNNKYIREGNNKYKGYRWSYTPQ